MDFFKKMIDAPINTIDEDELGLAHYAKSLSEFIKNLTGPFTVALQGEWGSGKSSLMNLLHIYLSKDLNKNIKFIPIDINVWEFYISSENFISDVLTELLKKILTFLGEKESLLLYKNQIIPKLCSLLKCGVKDMCSYLGINNVSDKITEYTSTNPIQDFRNSIQHILNAYNKNSTNNIVFFIDDLDRISPKLAVELLEIFKNIFDLKNCIFIIAVDYNIITAGLKEKLHNDYLEKANLYGAYFDKLIQLSFVMPTYTYDTRNYILNRLAVINYFDSNEILNIKENNNIKQIFFKALKNNPRQIKCLINSIYLSKTLYGNSSILNTTEQKLINLLLYTLQQAYPSVYDFILKHINFKNSNIEMNGQDKRYLQVINLDALCESDNYVKSSYDTIQFILTYIDSLLLNDDHPRETIKRLMEASYSIHGKGGNGLPFDFDGNLYTIYSTIQNKQGSELINRVPPILNSSVLDVGCGDGKTTLQLLKKLTNCVVDAIDISDSQLSIAKNIMKNSNLHNNKVEFFNKNLLSISDMEKYDVIFSNSTLHWINPIYNAYQIIYKALKIGGKIYIHQGGLGTYNEIHTIAKDTYSDMHLKDYFIDWTFPAIYPSKNEITYMLEDVGFINVTVDLSQTQEMDIDTLIQDFTVSSLPAYLSCMPNYIKDEYISKFKTNCKKKLDSVTAKRLYIEAQK